MVEKKEVKKSEPVKETKVVVSAEDAAVSHERDIETQFTLVRSHKDATGAWVWKKVKKN